ncbi:MAG: hypothetical protein AMS19_06230 [Gemmatimonas sp. SG8_23]|nr:MAG: hypothetical protein AMS19_06230 [Gemmatimonas sp. SG8_23]
MQLNLHEELLLLALHDKKGTNAFGTALDPGLGGALLAELLLRERVAVRSEGKKGLVTIVDRRRTGDLLVDEALARLEGAKRRADPKATVMRLTRIPKLRQKTARSLCRRGVLRETEGEVLLLFRRRVYPTVDPGPERALIDRVRQALEGDGEVSPRTAILVGLADTSGCLAAIYDRRKKKALAPRLKAIAEEAAAVQATRGVIEDIQAAIVVTTVIT